MNIAYVLPSSWACGGIHAVYYQANELISRGHKVTIFSPVMEAAEGFPLKAPFRTIPEGSAPAEKFDVLVHVREMYRMPGALGAGKNFLLLQDKDHLLVSGVKRSALLRDYADPQLHILAVSEWLAEFVREKCANNNVQVIGNGVDAGRFFPDPAPRDGMRLLIEGDFPDPMRNVIEAIEVANRVRQHQKVQIWALGRRFATPGTTVDAVFENASEDQIPGIYRQCDLLIKTAIIEGFGRSFLEAMACGCVPATYASGGLAEFCRHDENSLVTGVGNVSLLVWHILRFLGDERLRSRLRANAIAAARSMPWSRVAEKLEKAFRRGLGEEA
jgi:glycosyltransferase involved in cell wall biosynthesis